ncbi:MAG: hypothetical protein IT317_00610 [Anaerolineales bacterium]|nr:hypothetical protein [Anaerolineales bacterium]
MPKLANVNTTDLRAAIELGCRTMQHTFNAEDNYHSHFNAVVHPYAELSFSSALSDCHVPGRHLNALLAAEAAAGVRVDPAAVAHLRNTLYLSFSGPLCLPLNRLEQSGPVRVFSAHNLREAMHACYALVRFRGDAETRWLAERFIAEINRVWSPENGWDLAAFVAHDLIYQPVQGAVNGEARMIGPLVKYVRATGSPAALDLALRLKEVCLERHFWADGAYIKERVVTDHTHSITCTHTSLAQLADLLDDDALLQRVKAFYDNGLWVMRDELGWTGGAVVQAESDRGEVCNCGDMVETALILGRRGYPEYYADAERMLRAHLLPSQLRDVSWMKVDPDPNAPDGRRDAANRLRGAWGVPAPYGHWAHDLGLDSIGYYLDIVGSTTGSVVAALEAAVVTDATGHHVNLLFDHDGPTLRLTNLTAPEGLEILLKQAAPLWLRLPPWATPANVTLEGLDSASVQWLPGRLFVAHPPVGAPLRVLYDLPDTTLTLSPRVHAHPIRVRLHGDRVAAMDNWGMPLTFFDSLEPPDTAAV